MLNQDKNSETQNTIAQIEALLFVAPGSVSTAQIANALDISVKQVEKELIELEKMYNSSEFPRGIRLQKLHGRYQIVTAPNYAGLIEKFLGLETTTKLSRAALEALAIIAYKEPITRPQIDSIRGVNSDGVIKNLLSKGLIQEIGRSETIGRPILYSVTADFLQYFGLNSLEELPPLDNVINYSEPNNL